MLDSIQDFRWKGCRSCFYRNRDETLQKKRKRKEMMLMMLLMTQVEQMQFPNHSLSKSSSKILGSLLVYQDFCMRDILSLNDISLLPPSLSGSLRKTTMNEHHHRTRWSFFCLVMSLPVMNKQTSCLTHDCDIQTEKREREHFSLLHQHHSKGT